MITFTGSSTSPAAITTSQQGAQAASQILQTQELFYTSTTLLQNAASKAIDVMENDPTLASTTPVACGDYGQYTYSGSVDPSGNYSLTLTFSLCRENGFQFDGDLTANGTMSNVNGSLGSGSKAFQIVDFSDSAYSAITGSISSTLQYTMQGNRSSTNENYSITSAGTISAFDYVMLSDFRIIFDSLSAQYTMSIDPGTSNKTTNVNMNGVIAQSWGGGYVRISLSGFGISKTEYFLAAGPPPTYSGSDTLVNGSVSYDFNPASYGLNGTVTAATVTPIHHNYATGLSTGGGVTVSGNGSADVLFAADGSVDVSVGGTPLTFSSPGEYYLEKLVNFYGFEQAAPEFMGTTGTVPSASASGSSWPATMTVTALSSGPDLACFTDVHVNYYSPTDYPTKTVTWYVDYHVSGCTNPAGIPFEQAVDVDGDGICDAGLDINAAETDNTSGGLEHFTATKLPEGYYVLSINNYSCDTSVTNMASLVIGDYVFGTYSCSYTSSDYESNDPGAWCRLSDVRMNADGTVNVLTPDPAINPWHN